MDVLDRDRISKLMGQFFDKGLKACSLTSMIKVNENDTALVNVTIFRSMELEGGLEVLVGIVEGTIDDNGPLEELRNSEERFRNLVESTTDLVWETDTGLRYTYMSDRVIGLLGYDPEEMVGKEIDIFCPDG